MIFRYVVHALVHAYESLGWTRQEALDGCHHGIYSALMCWEGSGEPKEPPELTARKAQNAALAAHMLDADRSF